MAQDASRSFRADVRSDLRGDAIVRRWRDPNWTGRFYPATLAYGQSKLANLLFMRELAPRAGVWDRGPLRGRPPWLSAHRLATDPSSHSEQAPPLIDLIEPTPTQHPNEVYAIEPVDVAEMQLAGPRERFTTLRPRIAAAPAGPDDLALGGADVRELDAGHDALSRSADLVALVNAAARSAAPPSVRTR